LKVQFNLKKNSYGYSFKRHFQIRTKPMPLTYRYYLIPQEVEILAIDSLNNAASHDQGQAR